MAGKKDKDALVGRRGNKDAANGVREERKRRCEGEGG